MTPAGSTGRTRAERPWPARLPARSRWPAGTLAAAGTTPARTMNAYATLVISPGHHPANHRSAIPTRAYESGSGHGHDAAPAGHPHPPRPPPCPAIPPGPCPRRPSSAPIRDMGTQRIRPAPARHELQIPVHQPLAQPVTDLARPRHQTHNTREVTHSSNLPARSANSQERHGSHPCIKRSVAARALKHYRGNHHP